MTKPPSNILDRYEQLRPRIQRSAGTTESERYLARLADQTFLNLWSYPNPYRFQKLGGAGDGKELCDLLVVCTPHIIIFSEKDITWTDKATDVAWGRWYRKAVEDAAKQLKGAERWITEFPDRIYLDQSCETPFPLAFPPIGERRIHRVVVARGAAAACRAHFGGGMGTLVVRPGLKGKDHFDPTAGTYIPFAIGDIDPHGDFVHVFDEVALDLVMRELDTITDFTEYLDKRADFLRSGRLGQADGEEDLLAYYATRINAQGEHDFIPPAGKTWEEIGPVAISPGQFTRMVDDPQYRAKKLADEVSYAWDRLIEQFTNHLLDGTTIVLPGFTYSLTDSELAVRYMALQNRFYRRGHSEAILEALSIGRGQEVFFRALFSPEGSPTGETGLFILTLKYLDWMDASGGYEKYREFRTFYLKTYAQASLMRWPYLKRLIGIGMEPPRQGRGTSEDIIYAVQSDWTDADRTQVQEDCDRLGIMGPLRQRVYRGAEFPDIERPDRPARSAAKRSNAKVLGGNRKQRRHGCSRTAKIGKCA